MSPRCSSTAGACTCASSTRSARCERPLSDAQLEGKFNALVVPLLGEAKAGAITAACWRLASLPDVRELTALCRP